MTMPGEAPSAEMLRRRVTKMVHEGDVNVLTMRMVRRALENEFGPGTFKMKLVRRLVAAAIKSKSRLQIKLQIQADEQAEREQARKIAKWTQKRGPNSISNVFRHSPELQAITGERVSKRKEAIQKLWEYIRENGLQDPSDKKIINCTGNKLHDLFKVDSVNIFTINKHLKPHFLPVDEGYWDIDTPKKTEQKPKQNPFLTQYPISRALQSFLKTDQTKMSRAEASERMWEYIVENELMKSSGSHRIVCDKKLDKLFKRKSFSHLRLPKLIEGHFVSEEEAEAEVSETSDDEEKNEEGSKTSGSSDDETREEGSEEDAESSDDDSGDAKGTNPAKKLEESKDDSEDSSTGNSGDESEDDGS